MVWMVRGSSPGWRRQFQCCADRDTLSFSADCVFPGEKATEACCWPTTHFYCRVANGFELCLRLLSVPAQVCHRVVFTFTTYVYSCIIRNNKIWIVYIEPFYQFLFVLYANHIKYKTQLISKIFSVLFLVFFHFSFAHSSSHTHTHTHTYIYIYKGKVFPLQARRGPQGG